LFKVQKEGVIEMPGVVKRSKNKAESVVIDEPVVVVPEPIQVPIQVPVEKEVKKKKAPKVEKAVKVKREKKPVQVVAVVTPDGIEGTFTPEPRRPLIVNLPFRSGDVAFNDTEMRYDPSPPPSVQPYDDGQAYFKVNAEGASEEMQIGVEKEGWNMKVQQALAAPSGAAVLYDAAPTPLAHAPTSLSVAHGEPSPENYSRAQLMACYASKTGENMRVPERTDIACFWCTHEFENKPCFLPTKEESGVYHIYGNFCSPQCALSYLLEEHLDSHVRWERMALLHRMYRPQGKPGCRLYPSPPRESLKKFGGVYTYEQFRRVVSDNKVRVDIQIPPMVSILGTLDTKPIDFYDSSLQNTFTGGFSMDRFKAWSEQGGALRLKRSKPLKDKESTLDSCFKISIKRG
jgi:hypothetical protein